MRRPDVPRRGLDEGGAGRERVELQRPAEPLQRLVRGRPAATLLSQVRQVTLNVRGDGPACVTAGAFPDPESHSASRGQPKLSGSGKSW
jgi:hypothetical protein